jgi:hypothetical protein
VSATASNGAYASAEATYYFELEGPFDTTVPTSLSGIVGAGFSPPSVYVPTTNVAQSEVRILDVPDDILVLDLFACAPACGGGIMGGSFTQFLSLASNTEFEIGLTAVATPNSPGQSDVSAFAAADPLIQIDPTFLADNPGFSVVVSPGIINALSTPEPSTLNLILLPFGIGTYLVHRRSRRTRAVDRLK